ELLLTAFDLGITHIDAANNYGPPPGAAEEALGQILKTDLKNHRDELIIASKAGYKMWEGPYGDGGSRKYMMASLDQSLRRMGLEYVDIFYHHRPDEETPMEETMRALADMVRSGKALYVGVSNYSPAQTQKAQQLLAQEGVPLLIHQHRYNMLCRQPEEELYGYLQQAGIGSIAFCPLEQGLLTGRYVGGIPKDSRALDPNAVFFSQNDITPQRLEIVRGLNEVAEQRGQTLAQMALSWDIRPGACDYVIIGASRKQQIVENIECIRKTNFTQQETEAIEHILRAE
ncbi:MAG: aldo/keto reductase, partial [Oscillospiraceae bacterium]